MPEEPSNGGEATADDAPEIETPEKAMDELGEIVGQARGLSRDMYSADMKLFALLDAFGSDYLSGKDVAHYGPLIHNAFSDRDDTHAELEPFLDDLWEFLEDRDIVHSEPEDGEGSVEGAGEPMTEGDGEGAAAPDLEDLEEKV